MAARRTAVGHARRHPRNSPLAAEAIHQAKQYGNWLLRQFGPSRLLYGSDFPVSSFHGRVVSMADGFAWLYDHNVDWAYAGANLPTLVGIESLLALKQAASLLGLSDGKIESIFCTNARRLLGLREHEHAPSSFLGAAATTDPQQGGTAIGPHLEEKSHACFHNTTRAHWNCWTRSARPRRPVRGARGGGGADPGL